MNLSRIDAIIFFVSSHCFEMHLYIIYLFLKRYIIYFYFFMYIIYFFSIKRCHLHIYVIVGINVVTGRDGF